MSHFRLETGFGLYRKYRMLFAYYNLFRFGLRKELLGFDVANQFVQRVDKISMQLILKKNGAKVGNNCDIESGLIFHNCKDYSKLTIGNNCHIGKNCFFDLRDNIAIGDNAIVSMQVTFITHIDVGHSPLNEKFPATTQSINVKDGAYIGAKSTVLMGVTVGKECFIAAGSLVKDQVDDHLMVGGIPAKTLKSICM